MAALISQLSGLVGQAFSQGLGQNLVQAIPLSNQHPFWQPLYEALATTPESDVSPDRIAQLLPPSEGRDGIASFLSALFRYVKTGAGVNGADQAYVTFKAFLAVHVELQKLYATNDAAGYAYPFLNALILAVCRTLVAISHAAAGQSTKPIRDHASPRGIKDATRQAIEKTMQVSSAHMDASEWGAQGQDGVGDIMWALGNILWRLYAQRKLHTQATELSKTFGSAQPSEKARLESRGHLVPRTDVCETYYWRGRLGVVLLDMRGAKWWLDKAWAMCPPNAWQQRRAILIRLVPVNLLLGYVPNPALLREYDLPYAPFVAAFRSGNVAAWRQLLHEHRAWLRARSLWLLLFERAEILVWRNLFRKALAIHYQLDPSAAKNRVPTHVFLNAAREAFRGSGEAEDGDLGMHDVVCVVSSLVDQSLILGSLSFSNRFLVMKATPDGFGGFPKLSTVTPRAVQAIT